MFGRFTEPARQVVVLAQQEARTLKHEAVTPLHLLLGLLLEAEGQGAKAFIEVTEEIDDLTNNIKYICENVYGGYLLPYSKWDTVPISKEGKNVLELALREALSLGHNYVGTEHILLGLVRDPDSHIYEVLDNYDVSPQEVRDAVLGLIGAFTSADQVDDAPVAKTTIVSSGMVGTLVLHDWLTFNGVPFKGFHGELTILGDTNVLGFEAKGHNTANWFAQIKGETASITVLGCQVRAFIQGEEPTGEHMKLP